MDQLVNSEEMIEGFIRVGDVRAHYLESENRGGLNLLLIHGLGGSVESWKEVLRPLSESFHLVAVDLPGHGLSDKPRASYEIDYFASFICSFMKGMELGSTILAGHSMGAMIAIKAYAICPERIKRLILIDAAGVSETAAKIIREYMGDGWTLERLKKLYSERIIGRLGKLDEKRLRKMLVERSKQPALHAYLKSLNAISKPLSEEDFRRISAPTLIIWGSDDKLTPLTDGIKLSRLIPFSKLVVIEGAGHSPHSEAPEKFVEATLEFSRED